MFTNVWITKILWIMSRPCIWGLKKIRTFSNSLTVQPEDLQKTIYFKIWPDGYYVMHCSSSPNVTANWRTLHSKDASRNNGNVSFIINFQSSKVIIKTSEQNPSSWITRNTRESVSDTIIVCFVWEKQNETRHIFTFIHTGCFWRISTHPIQPLTISVALRLG